VPAMSVVVAISDEPLMGSGIAYGELAFHGQRRPIPTYLAYALESVKVGTFLHLNPPLNRAGEAFDPTSPKVTQAARLRKLALGQCG
jgi:hypothetical protein